MIDMWPSTFYIFVRVIIIVNANILNSPVSWFRCNSSRQFFNINKLCDGTPDCMDSSDESTNCKELIRYCPGFLFRCGYGACISTDKVCNGEKDCWDNSDETNCDKSCGKDRFLCKSGECISRNLVCDGQSNCGDGSDESTHLCSSIQCPTYTFKCDYGACVSLSSKCDGFSDCLDNSDEANCDKSCGKERFLCKSGECISRNHVCDGQSNCGDGSDESTHLCSPTQCPTYTFKCDYGACVSLSFKCDGKPDCLDNSDENTILCQQSHYCKTPIHPKNGNYSFLDKRYKSNYPIVQFNCKEGYLPNGKLNLYSVCYRGKWSIAKVTCVRRCKELVKISNMVSTICSNNGVIIPCNQTVVGSLAMLSCTNDEQKRIIATCNLEGNWNNYQNISCHTINNCTNSIRCKSGGCAGYNKLCDGFPDCVDGWDERRELCSSITCPSYSFRCGYGACVKREALCDGVRDCWDNSDENGCDEKNWCRSPKFPDKGRWIFVDGGIKVSKPGEKVGEATILRYRCKKGFLPNGKSKLFSLCLNGKWTIENVNCLPVCEKLKSTSTTLVKCYLNGQKIPCSEAISNTTAIFKCKNNCEDGSSISKTRICFNGKWI